MTDGHASARDPASPSESAPAVRLDGNLPGQSAIIELLRLQDDAPPRSRFARLFGLNALGPASKVWYEAAVSEIEVGDALEALSDEWIVLHALPVGAGTSDIDHITIGPGGVYIINTKNHPGQIVWASQRAFLVAGIRHPYIRNMEYEMGRAERLLSSAATLPVEVFGILAIVAARSITVREKHRDVTVLATRSLVDWLLARPVVLDRDDIVAIGAAAELGTTWHQDGEPVADKLELRNRFAGVRAEVRGAWRRQVAWAAATTIVGAGGFVLVTYSILISALATLAH